MAKRITDDDLELLGELGLDSTPAPAEARSAREQRIIAGFEEIERFVETHGRLPQHGEERDIFERLYAVRLGRMRELAECREVLAPLDSRGLLDSTDDSGLELSDDDLLASLGVQAGAQSDVTNLVHVRSYNEIKAAEDVAQRTPCPDFETFKPLFDQVQAELQSGVRHSTKYQDNAEIQQGDWFILDGQKALVAELGDGFKSDYGRPDRRLRVVYDNGTQSDLLMRSLQRALNKDKASRRISEAGAPRNLSLFENGGEDEADVEDNRASDSSGEASGTIYVLRSRSAHAFVAEHRALIHKIGVTGGEVKSRIANAKVDPTYLLADVDIVATFKLENINRQKLEALLHKFFAGARLDMELMDRFETAVKPREWFFVPLQVIEQVIDRITDGTLHNFRYDAETARLTPI